MLTCRSVCNGMSAPSGHQRNQNPREQLAIEYLEKLCVCDCSSWAQSPTCRQRYQVLHGVQRYGSAAKSVAKSLPWEVYPRTLPRLLMILPAPIGPLLESHAVPSELEILLCLAVANQTESRHPRLREL